METDAILSADVKGYSRLMGKIEGLPVEAVELAHPSREVRLGGLDQQMVVGIHQDIGG